MTHNIYSTRADGTWAQLDSRHSLEDGSPNPANIANDTQTDRLLLSDHFVYFGDAAPQIPASVRMHEGRDLCAVRQYKVKFDPGHVAKFVAWFGGLGVTGFPRPPSRMGHQRRASLRFLNAGVTRSPWEDDGMAWWGDRRWKWFAGLTASGAVFILAAWGSDGFRQSLLLELGAALLLFALIFRVEEMLSDRREEKGAVAALGPPPGLDDPLKFEQAVAARLQALFSAATVETHPHGEVDITMVTDGRTLGVEVKLLGALVPVRVIDQAAVSAASLGHPVLLVTATELTSVAERALSSKPDVRWVQWRGPSDDPALIAAVKKLLGRR